jgi:hypothetical protein
MRHQPLEPRPPNWLLSIIDCGQILGKDCTVCVCLCVCVLLCVCCRVCVYMCWVCSCRLSTFKGLVRRSVIVVNTISLLAWNNSNTLSTGHTQTAAKTHNRLIIIYKDDSLLPTPEPSGQDPADQVVPDAARRRGPPQDGGRRAPHRVHARQITHQLC